MRQEPPAAATSGIGAPFRYPVFRNVWIAGVLSNLGSQIQTVGAAWAMTQLTTSAQLIAAVQAATAAPMMLFAIVAGAVADLFDRRHVALAGLAVALACSVLLALLYWLGLVTPALLLLFCFAAALGNTLYSPAWQSSVREQVTSADLAPAIALNSISFNLGRGLGPAIGGAIVAAAGAAAAFAVNALSFLPLILALLLWRRPRTVPVAPRESLARAISLGVNFVVNAPAIRTVLLRVVLNAAGGGAILGLLPVVTRELLGGGALIFGLLLGAFGVGAILGAMLLPALRNRWHSEALIRTVAIAMGVSLIVVAVSPFALLTGAALLPAGACWTIASSTFNVSVQFSAPRWVSGRALATYQASVSGGTALGSLFWGGVASAAGVVVALVGAGLYLVLVQAIGLRHPLPRVGDRDEDAPRQTVDPEVRLPVSRRSGPITIMVHYSVAPEDAARFRSLMQEVRLIRKRNGANGWWLGRDMVEPERWIERYSFATWNDYLCFRSRPTMDERRLVAQIRALHRGEGRPRVFRILERPNAGMRDESDTIAGTSGDWGAA